VSAEFEATMLADPKIAHSFGTPESSPNGECIMNMSAHRSLMCALITLDRAALAWLWAVEGERPTAWDVRGALVALLGMAIIVLGPRR
jgi:Uncharacterised BCR, YnfA/UPF0060 family